MNPPKNHLEDYLAFSCDDIVEMMSKNVDLDEEQNTAGSCNKSWSGLYRNINFI